MRSVAGVGSASEDPEIRPPVHRCLAEDVLCTGLAPPGGFSGEFLVDPTGHLSESGPQEPAPLYGLNC
jgi:hypothetical protein